MDARPAQVASVSPLTVVLHGSTSATPARSLAKYTPTVGDLVAVVEYDVTKTSKRLLIVGALGASAEWTNITLAAGITAELTGYTPAARILGDEVELSGQVDGTIGTGGVIISTLPSQFRPAADVRIALASAVSPAAMALILTDGTLKVFVSASTTSISLDGIRYRLV